MLTSPTTKCGVSVSLATRDRGLEGRTSRVLSSGVKGLMVERHVCF